MAVIVVSSNIQSSEEVRILLYVDGIDLLTCARVSVCLYVLVRRFWPSMLSS